MENFLGVDIGGTNVKFGLVSENGELLSKQKIPTAEMRQGNFVENFTTALRDELAKTPEVKKVGIGVPGTLSKDRETTLELPNLPDLNQVRFLTALRQEFPGITFKIENDANAAALGEYYFAKDQTPESFIFITLGTGVGGAAVIDGKIFKGADGNAMEIGHMMASNGKTIEENIGKQGILGMALTTLEGYEGYSVLSEAKNLNPKQVVKAAHGSDELALEVFNEVGRYLGDALVGAVRLLDIKTVIIGGGVSDTFEYVRQNMYEVLHKHLTPYYLDKISIKLATLGNNAGIIGAASLCFVND